MALTTGLPVDRLISVDVAIAPIAVAQLSFQDLLVLGDSDIVDTGEGIVSYEGLTEVAAAHGTTSPEYSAAVLFFGQSPQPNRIQIGRWARTATGGRLVGGSLSATEQLMSAWTGITNGGFHITMDGGTSTNVTGINLSAQTNLNGVATQIQTALQALGGAFAAATVIWTGDHFRIKSGTTGTASTVNYLTAPTAGTDLSPQLKMTALTATRNVAGIAAENTACSSAEA
jgi:hypothetical protein